MFFTKTLAAALIGLCTITNPAFGYTIKDAQTCADEVIKTWEEGGDSSKFIHMDLFMSRVLGPPNRKLVNPDDRSLVVTRIKKMLQVRGENQLFSPVMESVEKANGKNNYRVTGTVSINTPQGTLHNETIVVLANVSGGRCRIYEVRVAKIMTLKGVINERLGQDKIFRDLLRERYIKWD